MLGTLMRAGDVLDLFTVEEPEWGVTATAQRLGIGKSLAHEALATMTEIGLLQRVGHGRYRLGWRTMSLASVLMRTTGLAACARPVIRDLGEGRGLTVSLLTWDRGRLLYLGHHCGPLTSGRSGPLAGTTVPADSGAAARVLLASRPQAEVTALWTGGALQEWHAGLAELLADLADVRCTGWAYDPPRSPRASVAAPIRDPEGDVVAALRVQPGCEEDELGLRRHATLAVAAANRISHALRTREHAA